MIKNVFQNSLGEILFASCLKLNYQIDLNKTLDYLQIMRKNSYDWLNLYQP